MMQHHTHLDEDALDAAARRLLDDGEAADADGCQVCGEAITAHARYLSLALLLSRDTLDPTGTPAVDAVRAIRRRSYRTRALRELATLVAASPIALER